MHEHHPNEEKNPLKRIIIAVILFVTAFFTDFKLIFFVFAYLIAGGDILFKAFKNIFQGEIFDENFLMSIATVGAFAVGEYPEAVMVMLLYQIGEFLQDKAVDKSRESISELMDIRPDYANIEKAGNLIKVNPKDVRTGDIIIVKTGEKIPLDGVVIEGEASVDTSALTGESVPRKIKTGENAVSGCINTNGALKIRVEKEFGNSTVSKILELVEHAQSKKAKAENFITKFAKIYTPLVCLAAVLLVAIPVFFGAEFIVWFKRALTFLVISCPCAIVISVPLSFFAGIGGASREGILIKGSCYIETLSNTKTAVFDKTGTLTKGSFKVTEAKSFTSDNILELAASAEFYSNHPIALSLKDAYGKQPPEPECVEEIAGKGIKAIINADEILVGNEQLVKGAVKAFGTVVYVAKNGEYIGYIVISDEIKPDSIDTIKDLKSLSVKTVMLTGDSATAGYSVGEKLGIDEVYTELLPADKVQKVEELMTGKGSLIFTGDGINDAPVLTRADAGIAMGGLGSDAAIEAADVVIMDDKPSKVVKAIQISKKTMCIVKQNIAFALGIKALFLVLGAFGMMTMWGAVFADVGVTLIAVMNSLRVLQNRKIFTL